MPFQVPPEAKAHLEPITDPKVIAEMERIIANALPPVKAPRKGKRKAT